MPTLTYWQSFQPKIIIGHQAKLLTWTTDNKTSQNYINDDQTDDININIIVSYEKLFIGTGFWVMPKQCQSMLCKGRVKRANPYLQAIFSALLSRVWGKGFLGHAKAMPEHALQRKSMLCKGREKHGKACQPLPTGNLFSLLGIMILR